MRCKHGKKYMLKKITQGNIFVVQQFFYMHKIAMISLCTWKNTRCSSSIFLFQHNTSNLNLKQRYFYSVQKIHNGPKMDQKFWA